MDAVADNMLLENQSSVEYALRGNNCRQGRIMNPVFGSGLIPTVLWNEEVC